SPSRIDSSPSTACYNSTISADVQSSSSGWCDNQASRRRRSCRFKGEERKRQLMPVDYYEKVWHNGEFIPWENATIHVASHVISYASCLFEGIRCYETQHGPAIFRLKEHIERLVNSSKIYRMELGYSREQLQQATIELVRTNDARHCYIRP